jgi:hypothetical protein
MYVSISFAYHRTTVTDWCDVGQATIDMLPDVALLEIFDCYVNHAQEENHGYLPKIPIQAWHTLVHVCRKWRTIVFGSPHRLHLHLLCTDRTPVKETLAVWPPLPIVIELYHQPAQIDNIMVALEHNDRVCQIELFITSSQLEKVLAAMQQPFPALTKLKIYLGTEDQREDGQLEGETLTVVPESFLGGSAPRLEHLRLGGVPFPRLPKLLLTATDLVNLYLWNTPHSGYISPEAIVCCLSTLTRLEKLSLEFESPRSCPVREGRRPHLLTPSVLPALTDFRFQGVSEYLEDLVVRIDTPLLNSLDIWLFHQLIFDTPQLAQFLARTPIIQPPIEARIVFSDFYVEVSSPRTLSRRFALRINCRQSDWQLSSLAQVCHSSFPQILIPMVEHLYICEGKYDRPRWQDDIEVNQWLEVLNPFTALKDLHVSREFLPRISSVFQELAGERVTEVLPALQSLFLEELHSSGPDQEAIEKFVTARQLAGHPIAVSHWDGEQDGL